MHHKPVTGVDVVTVEKGGLGSVVGKDGAADDNEEEDDEGEAGGAVVVVGAEVDVEYTPQAGL